MLKSPEEYPDNEPDEKATFIVQVQYMQNATWQGTITWTEKQMTKSYRSALELIRLMESAVDGKKDETPW